MKRKEANADTLERLPENDNVVGIEMLCNPVLLYIFSFLNPKSLAAASQVSRRVSFYLFESITSIISLQSINQPEVKYLMISSFFFLYLIVVSSWE